MTLMMTFSPGGILLQQLSPEIHVVPMHITLARVAVNHQDAVRPSRKTTLHQIVILSGSSGDQRLTWSGEHIVLPHEEAEDVPLVIVDILLHLCWTIGNTPLRTISVLTFIEGVMGCVPHYGVEVKARHVHSIKLAAFACGEAADGAIASITACCLCTRMSSTHSSCQETSKQGDSLDEVKDEIELGTNITIKEMGLEQLHQGRPFFQVMRKNASIMSRSCQSHVAAPLFHIGHWRVIPHSQENRDLFHSLTARPGFSWC